MPNAKDPGGPAYLASLMPWSESVPAEIRLKSKATDPIIDIDPSAFRDDEEKLKPFRAFSIETGKL